jgi:hypothetical protein
MTPTQSGYSTPTAGPSNLSILPPSSPPDIFWDDLHKLTSDIEQDRRSDGRSASDSSDPSSPVLSSMEVERCAGALVHWEPGSVWNSYPYQQHEAQALPWEPVGFEGNNQLRLLSSKCKEVLVTSKELDDRTCSQCRGIETSAAFARFVGRAAEPAKHTPWMYLSQRHLYQLLTKISAENRLLKLKVQIKLYHITILIYYYRLIICTKECLGYRSEQMTISELPCFFQSMISQDYAG